MNWVTLTESDVQTVLNGSELDAYRSSALSQGQGDPVASTISDVTDLVRGYCARVAELGPEGTIPASLKLDALDILSVRLARRVAKDPTDSRKAAHDDALKRLKDLNAKEVQPSLSSSGFSASTRLFTRDTLKGL